MASSVAADDDEAFAERLRSIRNLRQHWEERLASDGSLAAPVTAAASPSEANGLPLHAGAAPGGDLSEADPEALLTEAIRLTTLAHPPSSSSCGSNRPHSASLVDGPGDPRPPSSTMLSEALRLTELAHRSSAAPAHGDGARARTDQGPPDVAWGRSFALEGPDDQHPSYYNFQPASTSDGASNPPAHRSSAPSGEEATASRRNFPTKTDTRAVLLRRGPVSSAAAHLSGVGLDLVVRAHRVEICRVQASLAGMVRVGDYLLSVDGRSVQGYVQSDIENMLRGPQGSLVKLTLQSNSTLLTYEIELKREAVSSEGPRRPQDLAYYISDEAFGRPLFANEETVSALNALRRLVVDGEGTRQPLQLLPAMSVAGCGGTSMGILVNGQKKDGLWETGAHPHATVGTAPRVSGVVAGSPADRSGVRVGDILAAVDGIGVHNGNVMQLLRSSDLIGTISNVTVQRPEERGGGSKRLDLQVTRTAATALRRTEDLLHVLEWQTNQHARAGGTGNMVESEAPMISAVRRRIIEHEHQRQVEEFELAERLNNLQIEVLQLVAKCASSLCVTGSALASDGIENRFESQLRTSQMMMASLEEQCHVRSQEAIGLWQQLSQEREENARLRSDREGLVRRLTLLQQGAESQQQMVYDSSFKERGGDSSVLKQELEAAQDQLQLMQKERDELCSLLDGSVSKKEAEVYRDEILRLHDIIENLSAIPDVESNLQSLCQEYESRLRQQENMILAKAKQIEDMEEERKQLLKQSSTAELHFQKRIETLLSMNDREQQKQQHEISKLKADQKLAQLLAELKTAQAAKAEADRLVKETQEMLDAAEQRTHNTQHACDALAKRVEELTAKVQALERERETVKEELTAKVQALEHERGSVKKTQEMLDAAEQRTQSAQHACDALAKRVEELTAKVQALERESLCSKKDVIEAQQALATAQNELKVVQYEMGDLQAILQRAGLGMDEVSELASVLREAMVRGTVSGPAHLVRLLRMTNEGTLPTIDDIIQVFHFAVGREKNARLAAVEDQLVLDDTAEEQSSERIDRGRDEDAGVFVEMELDFAVSDEVAFRKALVHDIAFAVSGREDRIRVRRLEVGHIVVLVQLLPGVAAGGDMQEAEGKDYAGLQNDASFAARDLLNQVSDSSSALKRGRWTSKTRAIRLTGGREVGQDIEGWPFEWRAHDVKGFLVEAKGLVMSQLQSRLHGQALRGPAHACEQLRHHLEEEDLMNLSMKNELRFFSAENADLRDQLLRLSETTRILRTPPAPRLLPLGGVFTEDQIEVKVVSVPGSTIFVNVVEAPGLGQHEVRQNVASMYPGPQHFTHSGPGPQLCFFISETSIVTAKASIQDSPLSRSSVAYFVRIRGRDQDTGQQGRAGVGMVLEEVSDFQDIFIKALSENGPAQQSGQIHERDILLKVDGHDVAGLSLPAIAELIAGDPGSTVELELLHGASQDPSKNNPIFRKVVLTRTLSPLPAQPSPRVNTGALFADKVSRFFKSLGSDADASSSVSSKSLFPATMPGERYYGCDGTDGLDDDGTVVDSPPSMLVTI